MARQRSSRDRVGPVVGTEFVLVDKKGNTRARLGTEKDGAVELTLFDEQLRRRIVVGIRPAGEDVGAVAYVLLFAEDGREAFRLEEESYGMDLNMEVGNTRFHIGRGADSGDFFLSLGSLATPTLVIEPRTWAKSIALHLYRPGVRGPLISAEIDADGRIQLPAQPEPWS